MLKRLSFLLLSVLIAGALACGLPSTSALADDEGTFSKEELDQLLAPIALYPDDLLTNVLVASTYPLDVVSAARWKKEPANAKLKGEALEKALEAKDWDPSIKALIPFPEVLNTMSDKLDWTQKLGDAFLAQQDEVMDEIQFLRSKADEAGNLKSNKQQKVVKESGSDARPIYIIEPAEPERVYVPVYQPTVVYGSWWYPSYPPYYWSYPGAAFVNGFFWGAGIAVASNIWGWGHWDWHRHDIDINVNKWNNINVNRKPITSNKWEHRPDHRGPVPYKNKNVREKYTNKGDKRPGNKDFRGYDRDIDKSKIESKLKDTEHGAVKDKVKDRDVDRDKVKDKDRDGKPKDRAGDGGGKAKDKAGGGGGKAKDRAGDRKPDGDRKAASPKAKKPSPGAFDVKSGSDVRKNANRGHASRDAMKVNRPSGGGGAKINRGGGGGGGSRGGGGRGGGGRR